MKWILLLLIVFSSCNVVLLAPRTMVVKQVSGYLVYRGEECLFFVDDAPRDFFSKTYRGNGYRIYQGCGLDAMTYIADSYPVEKIYVNGVTETLIADTIKIVPVQLRYLPAKFKTALQIPVALKYKNEVYDYMVWNIFHGEVLSVNHRVIAK